MKLLLVNPFFKGVIWAPTMGLGFIGTYIKKNSDWDVEVIEPYFENLTKEQVLLKAKKADIVGLTCYTESRFQCFDFAESVRQINPDCKIIIGGPHVNTLDKQILQHYNFVDGVVRMEGEETMLDIVKDKPFEKIKGLTWRSKNKIIKNPDRPLIKDISNLEYDYSLIYNQIKNWKDLEIPYELQKKNHIPIITSRGCLFNCAFCAAHPQWGCIWRGKTPDKMVDEMEFLVNKYKIGYFRFYDALFIGDLKKINEFCDILEKRRLDVSFRIDIRVGTPRNVLERLKKVGCDVVGFGVESGSDKILKRINKRITRSMILKTIKDCNDLGYWSIGFFMVSLPDETMEDIKLSFDLFKYFDAYNYQFLKLHPNTAIYNELKRKGEIDDEIWFDKSCGIEIFYCKDNFPSARFSKKQVDLILHRMYFDFNAQNPGITFKRYGIKKGSIIYPISFLLSNVFKTKLGQNMFYAARSGKTYDRILTMYRKVYKG